ncbi:transposon Ty3-I Gag-Pol polyprotein [Trichonephila clavipes]|nr:transposon Ty3-I Gag-Pol polyprotein [Trichonephila clavipes]
MGIIQPAMSPWSSPVFLVRQKDNTWNFRVDYKGLNRITKKFVYPLLRIDDILDSLKSRSWGIRRVYNARSRKSSTSTRASKNDSTFTWGSDQKEPIEILKTALTPEPVLRLFDEKAPTELHADASHYGLGTVLVQMQKGKEKVIVYASRTLTKAERNYLMTERECLAFVWAVAKRNTLQKELLSKWKKWLPIIPKHLRLEILQHFHDFLTAGYLGFAKTYYRIRKRFFWSGLYRSVRRYIMHCRDCQRRKSFPQKPPGLLIPNPPSSVPTNALTLIFLKGFLDQHGLSFARITCLVSMLQKLYQLPKLKK